VRWFAIRTGRPRAWLRRGAQFQTKTTDYSVRQTTRQLPLLDQACVSAGCFASSSDGSITKTKFTLRLDRCTVARPPAPKGDERRRLSLRCAAASPVTPRRKLNKAAHSAASTTSRAQGLSLGLGFITTDCTGYATSRLSDDSRRTLNSLRRFVCGACAGEVYHVC